LAAAALPVADGGKERRVGIKECGKWKQRGPEWCEPIKRDGGKERCGHETPSEQSGEPDARIGSEGERDRNEESECEADQSAEELQRGIVELGEGGAGDHFADFGEAGIRAKAAAGASEAHPDFSAGAFDFSGERTVVDDFVADGGEPTDAFESGAAKKDTAAGGTSGFGACIGNPVWRVKHQKKVEERGDEEALDWRLRFE